jgi:S1-C subfamily serine protease
VPDLKQWGIWLITVVALALLVRGFDLDDSASPRRPLEADEGAWLKSEPAQIPDGKPIDSVGFEIDVYSDHVRGHDVGGTAFAVSPDTWVTAAHVVDDCKAAYVRVWGQWRRMEGFVAHASADAAILKSRPAAPPPALGITDRLPVLDQEGFHVGFPDGVPGTVRSKFIGMARLNRKARRSTEMSWVWAELERSPNPDGPLGGISGGPQVDRTGAVQGITVAATDRRGRIFTTPVAQVREVVPDVVPHASSGAASITALNFGQEGEHARTAGSIALVYCSASGRSRP